MVEQSTNNKLKILRSDNGGEFTSNEFDEYLKGHGIVHQVTVPKCPEQNGIAERYNRTLMEMACYPVQSYHRDSGLKPLILPPILETYVQHNRSKEKHRVRC